MRCDRGLARPALLIPWDDHMSRPPLAKLVQHVSTSTILPGRSLDARRSSRERPAGVTPPTLPYNCRFVGPVPLHSNFNFFGSTWYRTSSELRRSHQKYDSKLKSKYERAAWFRNRPRHLSQARVN
jgi:hypothetical protein